MRIHLCVYRPASRCVGRAFFFAEYLFLSNLMFIVCNDIAPKKEYNMEREQVISHIKQYIKDKGF